MTEKFLDISVSISPSTNASNTQEQQRLDGDDLPSKRNNAQKFGNIPSSGGSKSAISKDLKCLSSFRSKYLDPSQKYPPSSSSEEVISKIYPLVILVCGFMVIMVQIGMILSMGIYFVAYRDQFGYTRQEAALINSILYGLVLMMGPVSSFAYEHFGCRPCVIGGAVISSIGFVWLYFLYDLRYIYAAYSSVGIGLGLCGLATYSIQAEYFSTYQFFATAFLTVGATVGCFVFPPVFLCMLEMFGIHGSMLINAGIVLQLAVIGALMKTSRRKQQEKRLRTSIHVIAQFFKIDVCDTFPFHLLLLNSFMWGGWVNAFYSMIVDLMTQQDMSLLDCSSILMTSAAVGLVARVTSSCLAQARFTDLPIFFTAATSLSCLGLYWILLCRNNWLCFSMATSVTALGMGLMIPAHVPLCIHLFSVQNFPAVGGYMSFAIGLGGLIVPFLAGSLGDAVEDTTASFNLVIACNIAAALLSLGIVLVERVSKCRHRKSIC